ncbi:hypothetical protein [Aureimonas ureilytica]|uniref:hypothetical protein n=1 Tax=Aureimonas ureilytica TaxID=401562 RepID=UPI0007347108|nr:hypothetical protein [Aureimonas ureilytica]
MQPQTIVSGAFSPCRRCGNEVVVRRLAERIHRQLTRPCDIGVARPVTVGLSLGYATGLLSQVSLDDPMHRADARSYAVKRGGGGVLGPGEHVHCQPAALPPSRGEL